MEWVTLKELEHGFEEKVSSKQCPVQVEDERIGIADLGRAYLGGGFKVSRIGYPHSSSPPRLNSRRLLIEFGKRRVNKPSVGLRVHRLFDSKDRKKTAGANLLESSRIKI